MRFFYRSYHRVAVNVKAVVVHKPMQLSFLAKNSAPSLLTNTRKKTASRDKHQENSEEREGGCDGELLADRRCYCRPINFFFLYHLGGSRFQVEERGRYRLIIRNSLNPYRNPTQRSLKISTTQTNDKCRILINKIIIIIIFF